MAQYISKDALVAEIKRRKELVSDPILLGNDLMIGERNAYFNLLPFLDTLEVKEVDLEEYYHEFLQKEWFGNSHVRTVSEMMAFTAKHFFELGLFSQLTWQDIRLISEIGEDFMNSEESDDLWKDEEVYYTAILNKLKEKGRDYKTERQITRELEQKREEV